MLGPTNIVETDPDSQGRVRGARLPGRREEDFLIRVNRQPMPGDYVLQEGDRVTMTATKIEGAEAA